MSKPSTHVGEKETPTNSLYRKADSKEPPTRRDFQILPKQDRPREIKDLKDPEFINPIDGSHLMHVADGTIDQLKAKINELVKNK